MSVKDFIKKSVLEGFSPYNVPQMAGALLAALAMGCTSGSTRGSSSPAASP